MPTNLAIDEKLLNAAKRAGKFRITKETVTVALKELIARRDQRKILRSLGTFDLCEDWDYKKGRHERRR